MSVSQSTLEAETEFVLDGTHGSPKRAEQGVPVLSAQNVTGGQLSLETSRFTTEEEYAAFARRLSPKRGDVLLTIVGTIGRAAVLSQTPPPIVFQRSVSVIRPKPETLDSSYLFYVTQSEAFRRQLDRFTNKSSQAGVYLKKLKTAQIPLPPLTEQKRIVGILYAADALRAKRREALAQLDTLLQSTFLEMFGDCDRPPISIGEPKFGDPTNFVAISDCARLATGHTPDRNIAEYWGGEIPWISLTDIRDLDGTISTETIQNVTEEGIRNSSSVKLPAGTVCFSRTASVGFVTVMGKQMSTSQDFVNWVCGDRLEPIYLMWALRQSKPYLLSKSSGSTHKTIYYRHAEQFQVFLPRLDLQRRFAAIVEAAERQKARMRAHLTELDALFASLQSRAFNGEL